MKRNLLLVFCFITISLPAWETDFEKAKQLATEKHHLILLNFSGSDWCIPCIRMRKDIFDQPQFIAMADTTLVLVNADFPRKKKAQPGAVLKKQNENLAERYNPEGKFPFTLLLDANGRVLYQWDGLQDATAAEFAVQVKRICDAHK